MERLRRYRAANARNPQRAPVLQATACARVPTQGDAAGSGADSSPPSFAGLRSMLRRSGNSLTAGRSRQVESDGADLWVSRGSLVSRVRASDGKLLETWTGADIAFGVLPAMGRVFVTGESSPLGKLYRIDPSQWCGGGHHGGEQ